MPVQNHNESVLSLHGMIDVGSFNLNSCCSKENTHSAVQLSYSFAKYLACSAPTPASTAAANITHNELVLQAVAILKCPMITCLGLTAVNACGQRIVAIGVPIETLLIFCIVWSRLMRLAKNSNESCSARSLLSRSTDSPQVQTKEMLA